MGVFFKEKDEVLGCFLKWKNMVETQTGRRIKRLRTDNGGEYRNYPFAKMRVLFDTIQLEIHRNRMGWQNV